MQIELECVGTNNKYMKYTVFYNSKKIVTLL